MATLTNISKNSGTESTISKSLGFLLKEGGGVILKESDADDGGLLREQDADFVNISKNSGTLTNINKN